MKKLHEEIETHKDLPELKDRKKYYLEGDRVVVETFHIKEDNTEKQVSLMKLPIESAPKYVQRIVENME